MTTKLETIETIRALKAKYCRLLDTKQFDDLTSLFVPEATFVFRGLDGEAMYQYSSFGEWLPAVRGLFGTTRTIHQTHNSEIHLVSETEARAIWSMEDWHVYAPQGSDPSKTLHGYGFYHETFRLVDDQWKITSIDLHRNLMFFGIHAG